MKKLLLFIISIFIFTSVNSQTATSITNGNWTNPLTWNCTCVPTTGYSVTINHSVTLNTSMVFNTGGITINSVGSLIQDASLNRDIWINGGYFNNSGNANFRYFLISAGILNNSGNYTVAAMTNSVAFTNYGTITMDSMYVAGNLNNATGAKIIGDSLTNATGITFTNNGNVNVTWSTNNGTFINNNYHGGYAFTNAGLYNNNDSLILTGSTWNKARFYNNASGKVKLTKNFHNYSSSNTAAYINAGNVIASDSWYNTDTVRGPASGFFAVWDTSANSGKMLGNFTLCDLTPMTSSVDFNSGTIAGSVLFSCSIGIKENELSVSTIYPNPSNGIFNIKSDITEMNITIIDANGKIVLEKTISAGDNEIKLNFADGIYFMKLTDKQNGNSATRKLLIQN
jgi:hypothetical protein